jgi:S23 ribosomal protein.
MMGDRWPEAGVSYRDLDVWNNAMNLVAYIYDVSNMFPREETYGLIPQRSISNESESSYTV